ncbi:hypothetical protein FACS1894102_6940 [Spirochaetia bacterium]|nr:hypothetical protein FACS1894102_6940 [Spirochaetia bacterium]
MKFTLKKLFSCIILLSLFASCDRIPWELAFIKARAAITSFKLAGVDAVIDGIYIRVTLPTGTDVTNLTPEVTHTGVGYTPQTAQDFTNLVVYSVFDANSKQQAYDYIVSVSLSDTGNKNNRRSLFC